MNESKKWLIQARRDLLTAAHTIQSKDYYASVFFSQQAAEKCLKALYIKKFNELPKVHDLVFLAKKLFLPEDLTAQCDKLSKVYIETRYPLGAAIPSQKFSKRDAVEFLNLSRRVISWIKKQL